MPPSSSTIYTAFAAYSIPPGQSRKIHTPPPPNLNTLLAKVSLIAFNHLLIASVYRWLTRTQIGLRVTRWPFHIYHCQNDWVSSSKISCGLNISVSNVLISSGASGTSFPLLQGPNGLSSFPLTPVVIHMQEMLCFGWFSLIHIFHLSERKTASIK